MFNTFTYKWLHWLPPACTQTPLPPTLPPGISRFYIPTKSGKIEVLHAKTTNPNNDSSNPPSPIFFVHGGMGCAAYWLEYMTYLSARGVPCYAVSLRGHGNSWHPSFLRMVYGTTKRMLADDVLAGIRWAQAREGGREVVLVGHSSGGGLSQLILSEEEVRVKGLVLVAAVPGFGSTTVYLNWFRLDPWFTLRMVFHGWHPNSPLSHPALTRRVFFSERQTDEYVEEFQKLACPYESFLWPLGMGYQFVSPVRILQQISGSARGRVLVLAGGEDKIMTYPVMERLAAFYRTAYESLVGGNKNDGIADEGGGVVGSVPGEGGRDTAGQGVRLCVVPGVRHHLQNDVGWEVGAEKVLAFYKQL